MRPLFKSAIACALISSFCFADSVCANLCGICSVNMEDSTCIKTDSLCNCSLVLDNIQKVQNSSSVSENAKQNALAASKELLTYKLSNDCNKDVCTHKLYFKDGLFEKMEDGESSETFDALPKVGNAALIVDSAHALCNALSTCIVSVTYTSAEMVIMDLRIAEEPSKGSSIALPIANTASDTTKQQADTLKVEQEAKAEKTTEENEISKKQTEEKTVQPDKKKEDIFYTGFALTFGMFTPLNYIGIDGDDDFEFPLEAGFTWLLRWYFYRASSFQTGLGLFYSYSEYENDEILYTYATLNELTLEIPISFRIGAPIAKAFAPFIEFSFNLRKPLYGWVYLEVEDYSYSTFDWFKYAYDLNEKTDDKLRQSDFYNGSDWEFVGRIGAGIEFTRHFAIEFQWMLFEGMAGDTREYDNNWRVSTQIAW